MMMMMIIIETMTIVLVMITSLLRASQIFTYCLVHTQ